MINKKLTCIIILFVLLTSGLTFVKAEDFEDFDPLVDIVVSVNIDSIRCLEDGIDINSDPDFFVKVKINEEVFTSPVWENSCYLYDLGWSASLNVPDNYPYVDVVIELWDKDTNNQICDISPDDISCPDPYNAEMVYDIRTGHWRGDDNMGYGDESGYGRLNGCDDGSYYKVERDCELYFSITQNDYDSDLAPYWVEVYSYNTDPTESNMGSDLDEDLIVFEWEHFWGFDPSHYDDHANIDPEEDSINNIEEFMTSQWGSNPYGKDVFLELDQMGLGPNGEGVLVPATSEELIRTAYGRRSIVFHLDDGYMGGGEIIPFEEVSYILYDRDIYNHYFLDDNPDNWRRGVFRYAVFVNRHKPISGLEFAGDGTIIDFCRKGLNSFIVSSNTMKSASERLDKSLDFVFACAIFHELGHTMGFWMGHPPGCDNQLSKSPLQPGWWRYINYKSCMNYHYTYSILDYSDGTNGRNDFDDWGNLDFTHFENPDKQSESYQSTIKDEIIQFISDIFKILREKTKESKQDSSTFLN